MFSETHIQYDLGDFFCGMREMQFIPAVGGGDDVDSDTNNSNQRSNLHQTDLIQQSLSPKDSFKLL